MKKNRSQTESILSALADHPLSAQQLRQAVGAISPATLCRLTNQLHGQVVTLGQARATRYARPDDLRGMGWRFPVYRLDQNGDAHLLGELWRLRGGYWWQNTGGWPSQFYPSLPWFVRDLQPDGFIGRSFAKFHGPRLGLAERLADWRDDDMLVALLRRGEDMAGDLLIGEESVQRYLEASRKAEVTTAVGDYPAWAEASLAGALSIALIGGEQPKFSALAKRAGVGRQVLVKYSPPLSSEAGQRWSDLLVCEHIALGLLRSAGVPSSQSSIHRTGDRTFLEVRRFDRSGRFGRSGLHSLIAVIDQYGGCRKGWSSCAEELATRKLLTSEEARRLCDLDLFGQLIANQERDCTNIGLIPLNTERTRFRLAPVYDMLPTRYRPQDGETLSWEPYQPALSGAWGGMHELALRFWAAAARDRRISESFRKLCRANHDLLQRLGHGPRIIATH